MKKEVSGATKKKKNLANQLTDDINTQETGSTSASTEDNSPVKKKAPTTKRIIMKTTSKPAVTKKAGPKGQKIKPSKLEEAASSSFSQDSSSESEEMDEEEDSEDMDIESADFVEGDKKNVKR